MAMLLIGLGGSASAASVVGKDGKIHACYRTKGKAKGTLRVVHGKKCKHGEKKVAWNVGGPAGSPGSNGSAGTTGPAGPQGQPGSSGSSVSATALEAQIAGLKVEVSGLKELLQGVGPGDLTLALGKLQGISGLQLTEAVKSVPIVSSLCNEVATLPDGINALRTGIVGIAVLGAVGLSLDTSGLPALLSSYTCPS